MTAAGMRHLDQELASSSGRLGVVSAARCCMIHLCPVCKCCCCVAGSAAPDSKLLPPCCWHCYARMALCPQLICPLCSLSAGGKGESQPPATH